MRDAGLRVRTTLRIADQGGRAAAQHLPLPLARGRELQGAGHAVPAGIREGPSQLRDCECRLGSGRQQAGGLCRAMRAELDYQQKIATGRWLDAQRTC